MVCKRCGLPLLGSELYCPQCGAPVAEQPSAGKAPAGRRARPKRDTAADAPASQPAPEDDAAVIEAIDVPLEAPAEPAPEPAPEPRLGPRSVARSVLAELSPSQAVAARRRARLMGPLGLGLLAGCLVLFVIALAGLGVAEGLRIRGEKQVKDAAAHYEQGLAYLQRGDYELAAAEFEWALRLRPDYPEAKEKLIEARSKGTQQASPTAPGAESPPETLLAEGKAAYDRGAWDDAIQKIESLQQIDPSYEQVAVRKLLAGAYANSGLKLANEDRLEEAIRRFDQALALQPDNTDIQTQRRLATLYQSGIGVWSVDWNEAIKDFSAVYALQPDYRDTTQRLQKAYESSGDLAGQQGAWCDAAEYYGNALNLGAIADLTTKRDEAAQRCASPTAVPGGTPVPGGTFVASAGNMEDNSKRTNDWGAVRGRVLNSKGEGVPNAQVKVSAFDWSTVHTTDATGYFLIEFLTTETNYAVTLVGVPATSVEVPVKHAWTSTVNFTQVP